MHVLSSKEKLIVHLILGKRNANLIKNGSPTHITLKPRFIARGKHVTQSKKFKVVDQSIIEIALYQTLPSVT